MELETEQLKIRPPRIDDWAIYNSIVTCPDCGRFLPDKTPPGPEEERREDFRWLCQNFKDFSQHLICLKEDDSVLGWCYLSGYRETRDSRKVTASTKRKATASTYTIVIVLLPKYWNKGYASEVFQRLLDLAREVQSIKELWVDVDVRNTASLAIVNKQGFQDITDKGADFLLFRLDVS